MLGGLLAALIGLGGTPWAVAQQPAAPAGAVGSTPDEAARRADEALAAPAATAPAEEPPPVSGAPAINLLEMATKGGLFMYPIYFMSFLVVCFSIERALGLRRRRIVPTALAGELREMAASGTLDLRQAMRTAAQHPSTLATVLKAVVLRAGRPQAEVDQAFHEACDREAARLYKNVRPIELAISVTPLIGLLGTVQGMIMAFYVTAHAGSSVNKAEQLADGIYVALITTFAGLVVAIPAAYLAHHFEGRIQGWFREIEELFSDLLPHWHRFEGKVRLASRPAAAAAGSSPPAAPAAPAERAVAASPK